MVFTYKPLLSDNILPEDYWQKSCIPSDNLGEGLRKNLLPVFSPGFHLLVSGGAGIWCSDENELQPQEVSRHISFFARRDRYQ